MTKLYRGVNRRVAIELMGTGLLGLGLVIARANQPPRLPEVRDGDIPAGYHPVDPGEGGSAQKSAQTSQQARVRRLRWTKGASTLVVDIIAFPTAEGLQAYL